jgi:hypothetical protein
MVRSTVSDLARERGLQQVTRPPAIQPGDWVRLKRAPSLNGMGGKVLQVKSVSTAITKPGERYAWRVTFADGRSVLVSLVERLATEAEISEARRRREAA